MVCDIGVVVAAIAGHAIGVVGEALINHYGKETYNTISSKVTYINYLKKYAKNLLNI